MVIVSTVVKGFIWKFCREKRPIFVEKYFELATNVVQPATFSVQIVGFLKANIQLHSYHTIDKTYITIFYSRGKRLTKSVWQDFVILYGDPANGFDFHRDFLTPSDRIFQSSLPLDFTYSKHDETCGIIAAM